jgi:hypothetical protein
MFHLELINLLIANDAGMAPKNQHSAPSDQAPKF